MYNNLFKKSFVAIGLTSIMLMGQFFVNANTANAENDTPDLNPTNITVSCNANGSAKIDWTNPVSEALETYFIYRSKTSGDLGDKIYEYNRLGSADSGKTMSYTDSTISIGTKYYYTVKIKTVGGNISTNTAQYPLTCGTIEISSIKTKSVTSNSATISWVSNIKYDWTKNDGNICRAIYSNTSDLDGDLESSRSDVNDIVVVPNTPTLTANGNYLYETSLELNRFPGSNTIYYNVICRTSELVKESAVQSINVPVVADINPTNTSVVCSPTQTRTITWTNPASEALETYFIYRSKTSGDLGDKIYEYNRLGSADSGKTMSYTDSTISIGTKYYYTVKIKTVGGNISTNTAQYPLTCGTIAELQNQTSKESRDGQITEIKTKAKQLKEDRIDSILAELNELRDKVKEQAAEIKYLRNLTTGLVGVTEKMREQVNNFITYGVDDNTKRLGAGERAAVMHSFKSAFKKLPETETELEDAIKIASGRWPSQRSEQAETVAKTRFKFIYKRDANMNNPNDNAAVTVIAYGLRQSAANRNLKSEKQGIKIFDDIYGHVPSTTEEWNALQAITYSGATK